MMRFTEFQDWKYTDDTTVAEIVPNNSDSIIQRGVVELEAWRINSNSKSRCARNY